MGRKKIDESLEYKALRDAWLKFRQDDNKFEERMNLERSIHEEAQRMKRSNAIVDATNGGLSAYGIGKAIGRTSHKEREGVIDWAFEYCKLERPNLEDDGNF